jgi:integrase/recombinase XerD
MDISTVVSLRDRAVIAVMTYTFARVGAVVALAVEDYFPQQKRWWLRLREKNGKANEMPCHHKLEEYLDAYIKAAGVADERRRPLFRTAIGKKKNCGRGRCRARMSGTRCAAVLPTRELRPR